MEVELVLPETGWFGMSDKAVDLMRIQFQTAGRRFSERLRWRPGARQLTGEIRFGQPLKSIPTFRVNVFPGWSFNEKLRFARWRFRRRKQVIDLLGGKCARYARCGQSDIRVLQISHKHGDGRDDRKRYPHQDLLFAAILNGKRETSDLEVLCANCHILYEYEIGTRTDLYE